MIDSLFFISRLTGKIIFEKMWSHTLDRQTKISYVSYLLYEGGLDGPPFFSMHHCSFMHILASSLIIVLTCTKNANACLLAETLREILKYTKKLLLKKDENEELKEDDVLRGCVEISEFLEDNIDSGFPNFNSLQTALTSHQPAFSPSFPVTVPPFLGLWYAFGGCAQAANVPLRSTVFDVWMKHSACEVSMTQVYYNDQPREIEAVFVFPLSPSAAVCGFQVIISDRVVQGVVKEKKEAKKEYMEALAEGHGAYLLAQTSSDVFEMNIGNIPSNTSVTVSLRYVTELLTEASQIKFSLPLSLVRRPSSSSRFPSSSSSSSLVLCANVHIECTSVITAITTPTHTGFVTTQSMNECKGFITVDLSQLSVEFVLLIAVAEGWEPFTLLEHDEQADTHSLLLSFVPDLGKKNIAVVNTELLIVVDRSGSMAECQRIEQAASTLSAVIDALPDTCFFNIVSFGSNYNFLFPASMSCAEKEHRERALALAKTLKADMGGTDILRPLEKIFSSPLLVGYTRQIFLLTDGGVSEPLQVASLVRNHARNTRVFTFGIGVGASTVLCQETAAAGGGKAEMINEATGLRACVLRQLSRALQPSITDISIYWGGLHVTQVPYVLRPLFHGEPYRVYAFIEKDKKKITSEKQSGSYKNNSDNSSSCFRQEKYVARLSGWLGDGSSVHFDLIIQPHKISSPVSAHQFAPPGGPPVSFPSVIHTLAARELIRDLENNCSFLHCPLQRCADVLLICFCGQKYLAQIVLAYICNNNCNSNCDEKEIEMWLPSKKDVEEEIVKVGKKYSLVSVHTSFIAIEVRKKRENDDQKQDQKAKQLKHLPSPPAAVPRKKSIPCALTGAVSWRREAIQYRRNEVFVDLIERIECEWAPLGGVRHLSVTGSIKMKCFLSGMPEMIIGANSILLRSLDRFHQSVRTARFENDQTIALIPPDGEFELANYSVDADHVRLPIQLCVDASFVHNKLHIIVKLVVTIPKDKQARCAVSIPVDELCDSVVMTCEKGTATWRPESNDIIWSNKLYGGCSATLKIVCEVAKPAVENCAKLTLEVPGMLCSAAKLSYMKVVEKAGYEVRYHVRSLMVSNHYLCPYRIRELAAT